MRTKMTHAMRMEFADAIRGRYAAAAAFVASLSSAWHAGEIRPTFSMRPNHGICGAYKKSQHRSSLRVPLRRPHR